MGFNNHHATKLGLVRFELVVRSDNGLTKILRTNTELGIPVLEESARNYSREFRERGSKEVRLDYYDNDISDQDKRRYRTEVL